MRKGSFLSLVLFFLAPSVFGDQGELYLDAGTKPGWLWVQNPVVENGKYQSGYLEDFSAGIRYGLGDRIHVGFAVHLGSTFFDLSSGNAQVKGIEGTLTSSIFSLWVPAIISYRLNSGYDWTGVIELAFGYSGFKWRNASLTNKTNLLFSEEDLEQPWQNGMAGSISVLAQWRVNDWFGLEFGPSLNVGYMEGSNLAWFPGLAVRSSFIFGVGGGL